jgi:hypothetical protein
MEATQGRNVLQVDTHTLALPPVSAPWKQAHNTSSSGMSMCG